MVVLILYQVFYLSRSLRLRDLIKMLFYRNNKQGINNFIKIIGFESQLRQQIGSYVYSEINLLLYGTKARCIHHAIITF